MRVMVQTCAGIDVHQNMLMICVLDGPLSSAIPNMSFFKTGTTTKELHSLSVQLRSLGVTHVFMESTGQYWCPVFNILSRYDFDDIVLANPLKIKGIPGRKTDQKDSEWIAELGRHGMIPKSYVPESEIQDFRRLTRTRTKLINDRAQKRNRIHNVYQRANIKLTTYLP